MIDDTELRARLNSLASRTAPPAQDAPDLVAAVAERSRAGRRRQALVAAAVAAVVAVLLAVPAVRSDLGRDTDPASPPAGVYTTPTRGNLSDDVDLLEAMRGRPWRTDAGGRDVSEPPLDTRRVVYASDYADRRWVLVAGADPTALPPEDGVDPADLDELGSVAIAWFTGPMGAAPEEMRVYGEPRIVDADQPTAVLSPTEPFGSALVNHVIVVGGLRDQVQLSWFREIAPSGEIVRRFEAAQTSQGVAAVVAGQVDASIDRTVRYRIVRSGTEFSGLPITEPRPDFVPPAVDLARLRPAPAPAPGDAAVPVAVDEFLSHVGMWAHVIDFTVVWAGDLPMQGGGTARLSVLAAQFEGGPAWVVGALGWGSGTGFSTLACGSEIRSGTAIDQQFFVIRCGDTDQALPTSSLVIVAPPDMSAAKAWSADKDLLGTYPLTDGVAVVPVPEGLATVDVLDAAGDVVDTRGPMGHVDWGD